MKFVRKMQKLFRKMPKQKSFGPKIMICRNRSLIRQKICPLPVSEVLDPLVAYIIIISYIYIFFKFWVVVFLKTSWIHFNRLYQARIQQMPRRQKPHLTIIAHESRPRPNLELRRTPIYTGRVGKQTSRSSMQVPQGKFIDVKKRLLRLLYFFKRKTRF